MSTELTVRQRAQLVLRMLDGLTPGDWYMRGGSGWPASLVAAFKLDVPEHECGVWWPVAAEGVDQAHVYCAESRDQDFIAHAPDVVRTLAELLLEVTDAAERLANAVDEELLAYVESGGLPHAQIDVTRIQRAVAELREVPRKDCELCNEPLRAGDVRAHPSCVADLVDQQQWEDAK